MSWINVSNPSQHVSRDNRVYDEIVDKYKV